MLVPQSLEELLSQAFLKFNLRVTRIFTKDGGEIDHVDLIRDNDILYISKGESFIPPVALKPESDWVTLNVGGRYFTTSKSTLTIKEPCSMLARMFAEDQEGYLFTPSNLDKNKAYLIDRSPTYFEPILNYLRTGQLIYDNHVNPEGILEEARFFGIESIIRILEQIVLQKKTLRDELPLTRRDIIDALIKCPYSAELRFQGVNLAGADLNKLDLRNINFKYANLRGCKLMNSNLSWCCLERADLSHAILDGAQLLGVRCLCANMEYAQLKKCNFNDPKGINSQMEGVNLKGANLEGSDMGRINLRVATLKNANLQNCDLRDAELAGANLEVC